MSISYYNHATKLLHYIHTSTKITMLKDILSKIQSFFPPPPKRSIESWDFIMVFQEYYKGQIEIMFSTLKCQNDIQWTVVDNPIQKQALFLIKMSDKIVYDMAHELQILKIKDKRSNRLKLKEINTLIYTTDQSANPSLYNYLCFLRARLSPKNKQICEQEKYSAFNKNKINQYQVGPNGKLFTSEQQLRAKYHFLLTYSQQIKAKSDSTFTTEDTARQPFNLIMKHTGFIQLVPIQKVSQHSHLILNNLYSNVGPNVDCYFDFVSFLQKWLIFPMIVGLLVISLNSAFDYTVDNSPFDFIYALIIMLWSILFITRWEEIQKWAKVKFSSGRSELWTEHQQMISKKDFQKNYSLITGKIEHHLSIKLRILLSIASNLICLSMMMGTLVFVMYSLNARGFIDPDHKLFYSETVSSWALPGGIFDSKTFWAQIPNIVHVVVTNGFDENVYRPTVKKLAKMERHESRKGYENSIILKYFIYEFVITFADLFYIAFIRFDIQGLREQLLSLFFIDIVRRVIAESVVPWAKRYKQKRDSLLFIAKNNSNQSAKDGKIDAKVYKRQMSQTEQLQWGAINEINKEQYQPFDDYLEIITNIGYLVMISSCFPLAPTLIILAHQVQLLQDKYKVIHIFKRQLPSSYVGMGRWKNIIVFLCYISIVTNIMLFAFSSQQVVSYFPMMYESGKDLLYGNTDITTILGAAATGLFVNINDLVAQNATELQQNVVNNTNQQIQENNMFPDIVIPPQIEESSHTTENKELSAENKQIEFLHPTQSSLPLPPPFIVKQFKPPKKQAEVTFMAILFFIEHFFLLLFIGMRDILKRRKSQADIFLERRDYKRRIKKNLPKNILDPLIASTLVTTWIEKEGIIAKDNTEQSQISTSIVKQKMMSTKSTNDSSRLSKQNQIMDGNLDILKTQSTLENAFNQKGMKQE